MHQPDKVRICGDGRCTEYQLRIDPGEESAHTAAVSSNSSIVYQASVSEHAHLFISYPFHDMQMPHWAKVTYAPSPSGPTHHPQNPTLNQPAGLIFAALACTFPPLSTTASPPPLPRLLPVANNLAYTSPGNPRRMILTSFLHQSAEHVEAANKQKAVRRGMM
jgi:hypothetical protein